MAATPTRFSERAKAAADAAIEMAKAQGQIREGVIRAKGAQALQRGKNLDTLAGQATERAQAETEGEEPTTAGLPTFRIDAQNPTGRVSDAAGPESLLSIQPGSRGGGPQPFEGGGGNEGGGLDPAVAGALGGAGEVPPFLVSGTRQRGPEQVGTGVRLPVERTQVTARQNALRPRDVLAAQSRLGVARERTSARLAENLVESEGDTVGHRLLDIRRGEGEGSTRDVLSETIRRYGPRLGARVFREGVRVAEKLDFEERRERTKARFQGRLIEGRMRRREERSEARREAEPAEKVKDREAEILLKIGEGKNLTKEERTFLDERQRLSLTDKILREATQGVGGPTATPSEPQPLTNDALSDLQSEFEAQTGKSARSDFGDFRKFVREQGFEAP